MPTFLETFQKQSSENIIRYIEWYGRMPSGVAPVSVQSVNAWLWTNGAVGAAAPTVVDAGGTVSGTRTNYRVKAGTAGLSYKITVGVNFDDGQYLEEDILMEVVDT